MQTSGNISNTTFARNTNYIVDYNGLRFERDEYED